MKQISIIVFLVIVNFSCNEKKSYKNEDWENGFPKTRVTKENSSYEGEFTIIRLFEKNDSNIYIYEKYYDNGQIAERGKFFYDRKEGLWIRWYKNGLKSVEENYQDDHHVGLYKSWYPDGSVLEETEYK